MPVTQAGETPLAPIVGAVCAPDGVSRPERGSQQDHLLPEKKSRQLPGLEQTLK